MKVLTFFCMIFLISSGCISQTTSTTQKERDNLLESYGELRQEQDKQPYEFAIRDQLVGTWQLVELIFKEGDVPEQKTAIKVSLAASTRKNMTLEFFKEYARYGYKGAGGGIQAGGDYDIRSFLYADELHPYITISRRRGETFSRLLFGEAANLEESDTTFSRPLAPGIVVTFSKSESGTDELLHLTRYGRMELTLDGWAQTGNIQSTFKKIK